MEFFNKKEEVIDLQLTQFGRLLLSKGKFKPVYYSFFDDNILYNSAYAGFDEEQNNSESRINELQSIKPLVSATSAEKAFKENYNLILSGEEGQLSSEFQRTPDKMNLLSQPIGTSDINSEYAPSWTIQFLNGQISGSSSNLEVPGIDAGSLMLPIPQIECEVKISYEQTDEDGETSSDEIEDQPLSDLSVISRENEMFVLLKLQEKNASFQKKNFDIEMFEVIEEKKGTKAVETLRPLNFAKNNEIESDVDFLDEEFPDENKNYVEYYFDVLIDNEISDDVLCEFDPVNEKLGVYSDERTKTCQDVINKQKRKVFDIYEDESDYPGEIC